MCLVNFQVAAALSPEAQRQRGASGSCSYVTPVHSTPRQRYSHLLSSGQSTALSMTPSAAGGGLGVHEMGAGQLQALPGSGSSLELVAGSRQALAMYAGDESERANLPRDWQRLHRDRDLRVGVSLLSVGHQQCYLLLHLLSCVTSYCFFLSNINEASACLFLIQTITSSCLKKL